jgi:curved DNA-binding protein
VVLATGAVVRTVTVPPGTQPGSVLVEAGAGIVGAEGAGDLYAEVAVVVPTTLDADERDLWRRLADRSTFDARADP